MKVGLKAGLVGLLGVLGLGAGVLVARNHALTSGEKELASHGASGFEKGIASLKLAASLGSTEADYQIARAYSDGVVTKQDQQTAMQWFQKAAAKGHPEAMDIVGQALVEGHGVKSDPVAGVQLLKKSAEAGSLQGMWDFGRALSNGTGITKDGIQGDSWQDRAAEGGLLDAAFARGSILLLTGADSKKGVHFLEIAAAKGSLAAETGLREAYCGDIGTTPDPQKAVALLKKMVDEGDGDATFRLAVAYAKGEFGLKKDIDESVRLTRLAASKGSIKAKEIIDKVEGQSGAPIQVQGARLAADSYGFLRIQAVVRNTSREPHNARVQLDVIGQGGMILENFQKTFFGIPPGGAQLLDIAVDPTYINATVRVRDVQWQ